MGFSEAFAEITEFEMKRISLNYSVIHKFNDMLTHFCSFKDSPGDQGISIILNGEESELKFFMDGKGNKVKS